MNSHPAGTAYRDGESVGRPHDFFRSIPAVNHDAVRLGFQRRFVDRVLEHTLRYDHVLYCISNEIHTGYSPHWGWCWAGHRRQRVDAAGQRITVTERYWAPELNHRAHRAATERFWRKLMGGSAASRFHRPPTGLGLSEQAQRSSRSARLLTDAQPVLVCTPHNDLLGERSPNEADCLAEPGRPYAVYFPDGGTVKRDVSATKGALQLRWLDLTRSA